MSFATARELFLQADLCRVEGDHRVAQGDLSVELMPNAPPGELHVLVRCALGQEGRTRRALARLRALDHQGKPGEIATPRPRARP